MRMARVVTVAVLVGSVVSGCSKVPSAFQGRWQCDGSTQYEIGSNSIHYSNPHGLFAKDFTAAIESAVEYGGGTLITMKEPVPLSPTFLLKLEGTALRIDNMLCTKLYS